MIKIKIMETKALPPLPESFRPILWSLRWPDINVWEDREDIILNTINEGTFDQWRWLMRTYGKEEIAEVVRKRLVTEFHPESRRLAELLFDTRITRHAR